MHHQVLVARSRETKHNRMLRRIVALHSMLAAVSGFVPSAPLSSSSSSLQGNCMSAMSAHRLDDTLAVKRQTSRAWTSMSIDSPDRGRENGSDEASFTGGEELRIRILRRRLHQDWMARRLQSPAAFLHYDAAAKWAQDQACWKNKEDWVAWVESGEKKCSLIPSDPEQFYRSRGEWRGWSNFLGVDDVSTFNLDPEDLVGRAIQKAQESRRMMDLEQERQRKASKMTIARLRRRQRRISCVRSWKNAHKGISLL